MPARPRQLSLSLPTQDNVELLLRLSSSYSIPVVRGYCLNFFALNSSSLGLDQPLHSPKNVLRAATLVREYDSLQDTAIHLLMRPPYMPACSATVITALQHALSPLASALSDGAMSCPCEIHEFFRKTPVHVKPEYHCPDCKFHFEKDPGAEAAAQAARSVLELVQQHASSGCFHILVSAEVQVRTCNGYGS